MDDELEIEHDRLMNHLEQSSRRREGINSRTGELRQERGQFLEDTGYNKQGVSFLEKMNNMETEKRTDMLRTFLPGLESLLPAWKGQAQPDMLDGSPSVVPDNVEPFDPEEIDDHDRRFDEGEFEDDDAEFEEAG